jgi:hypothetical protein
MKTILLLVSIIVALAACEVNGEITPPDDTTAPSPDAATAILLPHTWQDAYEVWAAGDCSQSLACNPDWFWSTYEDGLPQCEAQVVAWDCEADPDCSEDYPANRWSQVSECSASFATVGCSVTWPQACIVALSH